MANRTYKRVSRESPLCQRMPWYYIYHHSQQHFDTSFSAGVQCPSLPISLVNGTVTGSDHTFNQTVTFSCANGYYITDQTQTVRSITLRCQANRQWSGSTPSCSGRCMTQTQTQTQTYLFRQDCRKSKVHYSRLRSCEEGREQDWKTGKSLKNKQRLKEVEGEIKRRKSVE